MQQLLFLDSWNWNWEREREKERHTHTWWWCGCSNRFLIIVSSRCCFFLITHTDIWPVKWGRRRMTLSAIVAHRRAPFHLAGYSTRDYSIPFATAPLPKISRRSFFFFCASRSLAFLFCPFFFCFFSTEKVEIRRTNKKKGPSGENELNLSLDATAGFYFFISFKIIVSY